VSKRDAIALRAIRCLVLLAATQGLVMLSVKEPLVSAFLLACAVCTVATAVALWFVIRR
jgi:hypothetical protein